MNTCHYELNIATITQSLIVNYTSFYLVVTPSCTALSQILTSSQAPLFKPHVLYTKNHILKKAKKAETLNIVFKLYILRLALPTLH